MKKSRPGLNAHGDASFTEGWGPLGHLDAPKMLALYEKYGTWTNVALAFGLTAHQVLRRCDVLGIRTRGVYRNCVRVERTP